MYSNYCISQLNPRQGKIFTPSINCRVFFQIGDSTITEAQKEVYLNEWKSKAIFTKPQKNKRFNHEQVKNPYNLFHYSFAIWNAIHNPDLLTKCQFILENGFDINSQDAKGNTNLHYSLELFNLELFETILTYQPDLLILNDEKKSALMVLIDEYDSGIFTDPNQVHFDDRTKKMQAIKKLISLVGMEHLYQQRNGFYLFKILDILISEQVHYNIHHETLIENLFNFSYSLSQQEKTDYVTKFKSQMELHSQVHEYLNCFIEKHLLEGRLKNNHLTEKIMQKI